MADTKPAKTTKADSAKKTVTEAVPSVSDVSNSLKGAFSGGDESLTKGEKLLAALGYIGFLCVLPLAIKPKSEFCQHHGKQALVLAIILMIFGAVGVFGKTALVFVGLVKTAVTVFMFLNAWFGKSMALPMINDMAKKISWD